MPEYLAPGVYVEEVSFRSKSIEGVSTTTTGFVGPARYGPVDLPLDVITSLGEYERVYGDRLPINFAGTRLQNYIWQAARSFFVEGGKRLYVSRIFQPNTPDDDGRARWPVAGTTFDNATFRVAARFPGDAGNMRVRITLSIGPNVLAREGAGSAQRTVARGLNDRDVVLITYPDLALPVTSPLQSPLLHPITSPLSTPPDILNYTFASAQEQRDALNRQTWSFTTNQPTPFTSALTLENHFRFDPSSPATSPSIRVVTATVTVYPADPESTTLVWDSLALDPQHRTNGLRDSIDAYFSAQPATLGQARTLPIIVETTLTSGLEVLRAIIGIADDPTVFEELVVRNGLAAYRDEIPNYAEATDLERSVSILLSGGNDGAAPTPDTYQGEASVTSTAKTGLRSLEDIDDISIVAAPGSTHNYDANRAEVDAIIGALISHATLMRYRIAVIDSGDGQSVADVRSMRGKFDSTYAALYYPWVLAFDPVTREEIPLPPSGFVTGIYARNDINRGVWKAPANEVVQMATGFEVVLNKAQQDVLNPLGVNCFRFFEGRGYRLWGARTISSDPEWKYVNLRRYFAYLEHSIDKGTQWAVFEPNGDQLWGNIRRTVEDFLFNEFVSGALFGEKAEKAFFVKCDRTTMTQNDIDNGRLICLIGVAPLRPAEFVIFRIGQWTADRK